MTTWHSVFWSPSKHRWLVRIGAEGRSQRQITVPVEVASSPRSRKAAEEWAREQLEEKREDVAAALKALAELAPIAIELWRADNRIAPKTRFDRISFVQNHILPTFGELPIEQIDVPKVRAWVRAMRFRGDARPSIGNRLSALSSLLSDLHAEGHGPDNRVATAKAVRNELPAMKKRAPVALGTDSFSTLISAEGVPFWFRLLCALAGLAGLEAGAALGLEIRDVVFHEGRPVALRVRQAVAMLGAEGHASIGPTKNEHRGSEERPRIVPIHPALAALLMQWFEVERERWCCRKAKPNDLLVSSSSGKPWRPKVADRLRREIEGLGLEVLPGLVFHRLRGCFLTWLAAAGVPKDQRQRLAGHAGDVEAEHYEVSGQLFEADQEAVSRIKVEVRDGRSKAQKSKTGRVVWEADHTRTSRLQTTNARGSAGVETTDCRVALPQGMERLCPRDSDGRQPAPHATPTPPLVAAVPFAVPCDESAAQQEHEIPTNEGAPGRNRTCDQRFRNSRALCIDALSYADSAAEASLNRPNGNGATIGNGLGFEAAVPDAVREARDGLRWMLFSFDAAEATLVGLEASS
jgi:integrase